MWAFVWVRNDFLNIPAWSWYWVHFKTFIPIWSSSRVCGWFVPADEASVGICLALPQVLHQAGITHREKLKIKNWRFSVAKNGGKKVLGFIVYEVPLAFLHLLANIYIYNLFIYLFFHPSSNNNISWNTSTLQWPCSLGSNKISKTSKYHLYFFFVKNFIIKNWSVELIFKKLC
jgi:hypothetical protein